MSIAIINLVPFVLSLLFAVPAIRTNLTRPMMAWATAGTMAVLFFWLLTFLPGIDESPILYSIAWVPDLGLTLNWYLDGLSLLFALVVTGIGVAVFLYAGYYLEERDELARFYMLLSAFTGAMLALVLAGNVLTMFIAWELTSIISYLLIGFKGAKSADARVGASRALVVTGAGGLALLVGLVLMGVAFGSYNIPDMLAGDLRDHPWYTAITVLLMIGAFTKSAQFPFHFWLPGGMSAPSPASAYLHSATMVKAGIYLLFRFYPVLGETLLWQNGLLGIGLITMFIGALFALRQRDLKGLLAYSTVSKLGSMVALIGLPGSEGLKAALVGVLAHATYKATFFLLAGTIEHSTGTRNLDELGGLRKRMPGVALIAAVVGLSMAGYPPLLGFVSKEVLLDAMLLETLGIIPIAIVFIASVLTVAVALLFVWDVFVSNPEREYHHFHAPPAPMNIGPGLLAAASLGLGLTIPQVVIPLIDPALDKEFSLYLFPPEVNTAVILSTVILILGPLFFAIRGLWLNMPWLNLPTAAEVYAAIIRGVEWSGDQLLKTQGGKLRYYLTSIMGVVSIIMLFGGYDALQPLSINIDSSADIVKIMLLALAIGATIAAIVSRRHLLAALAMGVMGYAIGGIFLLEPAPDVALVQFLVETLATVLIILMIGRISTEQRQEAMSRLWQGKRGRWGIARDAAISTLIGVSVGVFALTAIQDRDLRMAIAISVEEEAIEEQITANGNGEEAEEIAEGLLALPDQAMPAQWYLDNAYPETRATDVVASVLADFRATDTLLEITVFAIAAIGVLTLLTLPGADDLMRGQPLREVAASLAKQRQPKVSRQAEVTAPIVEQSAVSEVKTDESGQIIVPQGTADPNGAPLVKQGDGHTGSEDELEAALNLDTYGTWSQEHDVPRLSTPLTRNVASLVLPFALVISFTHVLYGGGGPGDGFTAGMVSGLAVALWYVVFGYFEARQRLSWLHPGRLITAGLIIALVNAIAGMVLADGFFNLYMLGDGDGPAGLKFVSSVIFELAIFLTVFGGATVIMEAIAHPREVETET